MTHLETAVQELLDRLTRIEQQINAIYVEQKRILDVDEAAAYLHLSKSFLYKLTSSKQIPYSRNEGRKKIYFLKTDLEAWVIQNQVPTNTEIKRIVSIQLQQNEQKRKRA
jgi:excisionase family DNA binding protein